MFFEEAWFQHAVDATVTHLAQQRRSVVEGSVRIQTGVVGKTFPINRMGVVDMEEINVRDSDTKYANPPQSKRRGVMRDFALALLFEDFDELRTLTNPQSEASISLGYSLERKKDDLVLNVAGLGAAGASGGKVGGALGMVTSVDEAGESSALVDLPGAQQIVNGGTNLTPTKLRTVNRMFEEADVPEEDRYFFYSPRGMEKMLSDATVTSADFNTIKALASGGFPADQTWMNMKWRKSNKLPKSGNIRSCIALQKMGVKMGLGLVKGVSISKASHKWDNPQAIIKLSGGAGRADDALVIQCDIDETA
jgi:hypothetical protein